MGKKKALSVIILCLGIALVLFGAWTLIQAENSHTGYGGGTSRASTSIQFGDDFYTTSAQYSGLAANAVVDLYELTAYAICAFSVFFGGVDICVALLHLSSLKKPRKEEPTAGQYAEPVGEETVGE